MASTTSTLNAKDIITKVTADILGDIYDRLSNETGKISVEWARANGAQISPEQEGAAIEQLKHMIPKPTQYPALEITTPHVLGAPAKVEKAKAKSGPATGKKGPATGGRKADSFKLVVAPPGKELTKCKALLTTAKSKGVPCGRDAVRALDEHDCDNDECASMLCNHMYCGQHIAKYSGGEVKVLDNMKADQKKPVSSNGQTIDSSTASAVEPEVAKSAGISSVAKILAAQKAKKAAEAAAK